MDMLRFYDVYEENKRLDELFFQKYQQDIDLYRKNCIELLVELGEFINETRVFKYWSVKKADEDKVLEEYADVITMCLTFCNEMSINLLEIDISKHDNYDILALINYLYAQITLLMEHKSKELAQAIFIHVLYLGELLDLTFADVIEALKRKQKIIEERLNSDY